MNYKLILSLLTCVFSGINCYINFARFEGSLKRGGPLQSRTVRALQSGRFRNEASGAVENYTKWPILHHSVEENHGIFTMKLPREINPGSMEGFAARHADSTARGLWMRYSFVIDSDIMLHFMLSAPYSFDFYDNWLAVAACEFKSCLCESMTAEFMYYNHYDFLDRRKYNKYVALVKKCDDNVCILGWMDTSHTPVIRIKVFPRSYFDLDDDIRKDLSDLTPDAYHSFINYFLR